MARHKEQSAEAKVHALQSELRQMRADMELRLAQIERAANGTYHLTAEVHRRSSELAAAWEKFHEVLQSDRRLAQAHVVRTG